MVEQYLYDEALGRIEALQRDSADHFEWLENRILKLQSRVRELEAIEARAKEVMDSALCDVDVPNQHGKRARIELAVAKRVLDGSADG